MYWPGDSQHPRYTLYLTMNDLYVISAIKGVIHRPYRLLNLPIHDLQSMCWSGGVQHFCLYYISPWKIFLVSASLLLTIIHNNDLA